MYRPSVVDLQSKTTSYYAVVIGVAKRAREIAEKANLEKVILDEKPVSLAVEELARDEFKIIEAE